MANYIGSLEAVDCHINSVRYDMVLEKCFRTCQIGPHEVTVYCSHKYFIATTKNVQRSAGEYVSRKFSCLFASTCM